MQVFASGLDLEAMSLAAFDDFAHARLGAQQAEQIRAGAHRGAVGLDQMAGLAAHCVKGFLAERDGDPSRSFSLVVAARGRGQRERREVRGLVARVAQRERPLASRR